MQVAAQAIGVGDFSDKMIFDLRTGVLLLLECVGIVTVFALVWIVLVSYEPKLGVWLAVLTMVICLASASLFCYSRYREPRHSGLG